MWVLDLWVLWSELLTVVIHHTWRSARGDATTLRITFVMAKRYTCGPALGGNPVTCAWNADEHMSESSATSFQQWAESFRLLPTSFDEKCVLLTFLNISCSYAFFLRVLWSVLMCSCAHVPKSLESLSAPMCFSTSYVLNIFMFLRGLKSLSAHVSQHLMFLRVLVLRVFFWRVLCFKILCM